MTNQHRNPLGSLRRMAEILGAAVVASAAIRNHRRPSDQALKTLGIDPEHFPRT